MNKFFTVPKSRRYCQHSNEANPSSGLLDTVTELNCHFVHETNARDKYHNAAERHSRKCQRLSTVYIHQTFCGLTTVISYDTKFKGVVAVRVEIDCNE